LAFARSSLILTNYLLPLSKALVTRRSMINLEPIMLGVVAGVITAVAVFLLKELWIKVLLPLYQNIRYQGADISDSWSKEYESKEKESITTFSLVLNQSAHKVKG